MSLTGQSLRLWRAFNGPPEGFGPALEQEYLAARLDEYRRFSRNVGIAGAALALGLWVRDYTGDPTGAQGTLPLRLIMASVVALYVASLVLAPRRGFMLACAYTAIVVVEFMVLTIWSRLAGGYAASFPGYMYIYLVAQLVLLPFSFRESAAAFVLIAVVPNLQVAAGIAPGFPLLSFNTLIWPACVISIFAQLQFDGLFRKVFLAQRRLTEYATRDALTGLANRRDFLARAAGALALAGRHRRAFCLLMIDIDHFKAVNDRFGHAAGDEVLRAVAQAVVSTLRGTDVCGRLGGEEFAACLPETNERDGIASAERVRAAVENCVAATADGSRIRVTVSLGVAALEPGCETLQALLERADEALYQAKREGRNRVVTAKAVLGPGAPAAAAGAGLAETRMA